jgi:hypothetical protein
MNAVEEWLAVVISIRLILALEVAGKCNSKGSPISN